MTFTIFVVLWKKKTIIKRLIPQKFKPPKKKCVLNCRKLTAQLVLPSNSWINKNQKFKGKEKKHTNLILNWFIFISHYYLELSTEFSFLTMINFYNTTAFYINSVYIYVRNKVYELILNIRLAIGHRFD